MIDVTKLTCRRVSTPGERFLYQGGYDDREAGLEPQQWDDPNYRRGYVQAICDSIDGDAYKPVEYIR